MIDIHSHILANIDHGSRNTKETFVILNEAINAGFTDVFLTSHYLPEEEGNIDAAERELMIADLRKQLKENNININLYNGAEAYICQNLDVLIKQGLIPTLNNSRYILMEIPLNSKVIYLDDVVFKLLSMNLIPIIAHPERYMVVQNNPNMLLDLIQKGVLFQSNLGSIIGHYGSVSQKIVKKLLRHNMIHFLASDAHRENSVFKNMNEVLKALRKIVDDETIEILTEENPRKVIENREIDIDDPIRIKKFF